jgi:glycosyltransferase involved in cell wall biosynthesis
MTRALISVIIPIYNVEKYLSKCIESVINQSYSNLEIILVNDGSTDNSAIICNEYGAKDSRIRVLHKNNGGLSDARNVGIDNATGDYLYFLDSDDYIDSRTIQLLFKESIQFDSDITIGNIVLVNENYEVNKTFDFESRTMQFNSNDSINVLYNQDQLIIQFSIACNKLYKASLFQSLRFPIGKIHEDEFVNYKLFFWSKKICFVADAFYFYLQRSASIMGTVSVKSKFNALEAFFERTIFFKEKKNYNLSGISGYRFLRMTNDFLLQTEYVKQLNSEQIHFLRTSKKLIYMHLIQNKFVSLKRKTILIFFFIKPNFIQLINKQRKF